MEAQFREDYNTATMPSKKYYAIEAWEKKEGAKERGIVGFAMSSMSSVWLWILQRV